LKAFIDTSSLIKKYIQEQNSDKFNSFLDDVSQVIVSPVYFVEINAAFQRIFREKKITSKEREYLKNEAFRDYEYFYKINWNEKLEKNALDIAEKYALKTLDSLQLASAVLSGADIFVTSDKILLRAARKEIKNVLLI